MYDALRVFMFILLTLEMWKGGPGVGCEYCVSRMVLLVGA
jgi:hypothetical protein